MLPHQSNSKFGVSVEQTSGDMRWLYNNRSHQLFSARSTVHSVCIRLVSFSHLFSWPTFFSHSSPSKRPSRPIHFISGFGSNHLILSYSLIIILKHICMMNMLNSVESWRTAWFARHLGIDNVLNVLEALKELGELRGVTLMLTWGYIRQVLQRSVVATAAAGHPKAAEGCPKVTEKTAAAKRECSECLGIRNILRCYDPQAYVFVDSISFLLYRFYSVLFVF